VSATELGEPPVIAADLLSTVEQELQSTPFIDVHTHLFMPSLGGLALWGIDELVTYHYLEAELFRSSRIRPAEYFAMEKRQRADTIWKALFVENAPLSEATRGVIAVLSAFGLSTDRPDLGEARDFFEAQVLDQHINRVFELGGISEAIMTNDPLDPAEAAAWEKGAQPDPRFHAALRLDRILNKWCDYWRVLQSQGYETDEHASPRAIAETRRFLGDWVKRMKPVYLAVSLPDTFQFPEDSLRGRLLASAILPACREFDLPLSLMIGVRYLVNPELKLAGDAVGKSDLRAVERLCADYPENRYLISVLSRENQHELCVYARKFSNLLPFGCWWFLNNPSIVEEVTRERLEMLGTSFIPQHSDARVLDQVVYKWRNARRTVAPILANAYKLLAEDGRATTRAEIRRDITRLFRSNFERWVNLGGRSKTGPRRTIS